MSTFAKRKRVTTFNKRPRAINNGTQLRNFVFTLNNPTDEDKTFFKDQEEELDDHVRYGVGQLESGTNQTKHIQGYIELKKPRTFNTVKNWLPGNPHIERREGTAQQAADYCRKSQSRCTGDEAWSFEFGEISHQGVGKDSIKNVAQAIEEGNNLDFIEECFPTQYLLHKNKIVDRYLEKQGSRHLVPNKNNVWIFTGPSGSGKTTTAWKEFPEAYKGVWPTGGRWWWPNYKGQETIIFDEFRENISYQQALALFDIHPMSIEYKGGNTQNVSKRIIITTIRDPKTWFKGVEDKSELERRINENATIFDFSGEEEDEDNDEDILCFVKTARVGAFKFDEYDFSVNE